MLFYCLLWFGSKLFPTRLMYSEMELWEGDWVMGGDTPSADWSIYELLAYCALRRWSLAGGSHWEWELEGRFVVLSPAPPFSFCFPPVLGEQFSSAMPFYHVSSLESVKQWAEPPGNWGKPSLLPVLFPNNSVVDDFIHHICSFAFFRVVWNWNHRVASHSAIWIYWLQALRGVMNCFLYCWVMFCCMCIGTD